MDLLSSLGSFYPLAGDAQHDAKQPLLVTNI
jgi:hypothetical protein